MNNDKDHPRYSEWHDDTTAQEYGTPFRAWLAAAYPSERATEAGTPAKGGIKRYREIAGDLFSTDDGKWVLYTDHLAALEARAEKARREGYLKGMEHAKGLYEAGRGIATAQRTAGGDAGYQRALEEIAAQRGKGECINDVLDIADSALAGLYTDEPVAEAAAQADGPIKPAIWDARTQFVWEEVQQVAREYAASLPRIASFELVDCGTCGCQVTLPTEERTAPTAQPTLPDDERAAFEAWAEENAIRTDLGSWEAWKARAALRHPPVTNGADVDVLRDMLAIQEACGLHTDEYAPGSVVEYIKELEDDTAQPTQAGAEPAAAATIDTPEFQKFIGALVNQEYENYVEFIGRLVAHIDAAIAAAREEAKAELEQLRSQNLYMVEERDAMKATIADLRARLASAGAGEAVEKLSELARGLGIPPMLLTKPAGWLFKLGEAIATQAKAGRAAQDAARQDSAAADKGDA